VAKHPEHLKLENLIKRHIARHERSLQREMGASEIGTPCDRRLALKAMGAPEVNLNQSADWRPTVGAAVHTWLHAAVDAENKRIKSEALMPELALPVGTLAPGIELPGHTDLYDADWPGIVDWKILGVTSMREIAARIKRGEADPLGPEYRTQIHMYGRGVKMKLKLPVEHVGCYMLPNNGTLNDGVFWTEPFDLDFANHQLNRARRIYAEVSNPDGLDAYIRNLPTEFHYCGHCPFFAPNAKPDQWRQCKGDPKMAVEDDTAKGLIA
jgi:hypothetical protein